MTHSFWSQWVLADAPGIGPARMPLLLSARPGLSCSQAGGSDSGRACLRVADPPPDLLADWRFPRVPDGHPDPAGLGGYRAAVLAALALWREGWTQAVEYGGQTYTLRAGPDGQANFTRYAVALREQLAAGVTGAADVLPVQDAGGAVHGLAAADILGLLAVYSRAVMLRELEWNATAGAALAAQSAADLDAITWGD